MAENSHNETCLIVALSNGDFKAFGALYEKYHPSLYGFAMYLSKNQHEAEDLVQSVFVTVWETRTAVDPSKSFGGYLYRIAQNRFYDLLRKRVTESCYADYVAVNGQTLADDVVVQMEESEMKEIIQRLLEQVPERRRLIFRLNRYENLTYKQIAEQLHISENTVDTQIRHVLNFLRKELPKYLTALFLLFR